MVRKTQTQSKERKKTPKKFQNQTRSYEQRRNRPPVHSPPTWLRFSSIESRQFGPFCYATISDESDIGIVVNRHSRYATLQDLHFW